jgi:hypothetical protein
MSTALIISRGNTLYLRGVRILRPAFIKPCRSNTKTSRHNVGEAGTGIRTANVAASDTAQPIVTLDSLEQEAQQAFHSTVLVIDVHKH